MGAAVAIIQEQRILLTKREDFEVWCLPGGTIEAGESMAEAAIREAEEETGLVVELTGLLGIHSRLDGNGDIHLAIFHAKPVGGQLDPQVGEVIDIGFFGVDDLPDDVMPWHHRPTLDALAGVTGASYTTRVYTSLKARTRRELYDLRDRSGMSRLEFFRNAFLVEGALVMQRDV